MAKATQVSRQFREKVANTVYTRRIMFLPTNDAEADVAAKEMVNREGWTLESPARVAEKYGWTNRPAVKLTLKAVARLAKVR